MHPQESSARSTISPTPVQPAAPPPPPPAPVVKGPLPSEHLIIQETFDLLANRCQQATQQLPLKRKLDEVKKKLDVLYDKLRENKVTLERQGYPLFALCSLFSFRFRSVSCKAFIKSLGTFDNTIIKHRWPSITNWLRVRISLKPVNTCRQWRFFFNAVFNWTCTANEETNCCFSLDSFCRELCRVRNLFSLDCFFFFIRWWRERLGWWFFIIIIIPIPHLLEVIIAFSLLCLFVCFYCFPTNISDRRFLLVTWFGAILDQHSGTMNRDERSSSSPPPPSLSSLLQQYTTRTGEREVLWKEGTRACREQQKGLWQRLARIWSSLSSFIPVQTTEIERLRQTVNQLQAKANVSSESGATGSRAQDDRTNLNYKTKYDEAEARCRQWETRFRQLESNTIKPLQDKVDQLQRDYQHMKVRENSIEVSRCIWIFRVSKIALLRFVLLVNWRTVNWNNWNLSSCLIRLNRWPSKPSPTKMIFINKRSNYAIFYSPRIIIFSCEWRKCSIENANATKNHPVTTSSTFVVSAMYIRHLFCSVQVIRKKKSQAARERDMDWAILWQRRDLCSRLAGLWILLVSVLRLLNIPFVVWHAWSISKTRSVPTLSRKRTHQWNREDLSTKVGLIDETSTVGRWQVNLGHTCVLRKLAWVWHRRFPPLILMSVSVFSIGSVGSLSVFTFFHRWRAESIARCEASGTQFLSDQSRIGSSAGSAWKVRYSSTVRTAVASTTTVRSSGTTQSWSEFSISRAVIARFFLLSSSSCLFEYIYIPVCWTMFFCCFWIHVAKSSFAMDSDMCVCVCC